MYLRTVFFVFYKKEHLVKFRYFAILCDEKLNYCLYFTEEMEINDLFGRLFFMTSLRRNTWDACILVYIERRDHTPIPWYHLNIPWDKISYFSRGVALLLEDDVAKKK